MSNYEDLKVWQRSRQLSVELHRRFPIARSRASPGLRTQLLRACSSIAANIAEGSSQPSATQFARFLDIAIGSASEAESHLSLAVVLQLLLPERSDPLDEIRQIRRMLYGLKRSLKL